MNPNARRLYFDHFSRRLLERYGLIATDRLYNDIIWQIQNNNQFTRITRINRQRSIHCVYVGPQRVYVVYRKNKRALITALPPSKRLSAAYDEQKKAAAQTSISNPATNRPGLPQ